MPEKLTQKRVQELEPREAPYDVADAAVRGFGVRVHPTGKRAYFIRYRSPDTNRWTRMKVGDSDRLTCFEARAMGKKALARVAQGDDPQGEKRQAMTLGRFVEEIYAPWALKELRDGPGIIRRLTTTFAEFQDRRLGDIDKRTVSAWLARRHTQVTKSTARKDVRVLSACLNRAVEWSVLEANPLAGMRLPKLDSGRAPRFLNELEQARLMQALDDREEEIRQRRDEENADRKARGFEPLPDLRACAYADHLKPMILVALNTGLRRGEAFNLEWQDIDLERRVLTVQGAGSKSGQSRHIPLNETLAAALSGWRAQQGDAAGLVFKDPLTGGRFTSIRTDWDRVRHAAGLDDVRFHDLRHSFASSLVLRGVDLYVVKELLGHSSIAMTEIYSHLQPEAKAAAVGRLDEAAGQVVPFG